MSSQGIDIKYKCPNGEQGDHKPGKCRHSKYTAHLRTISANYKEYKECKHKSSHFIIQNLKYYGNDLKNVGGSNLTKNKKFTELTVYYNAKYDKDDKEIKKPLLLRLKEVGDKVHWYENTGRGGKNTKWKVIQNGEKRFYPYGSPTDALKRELDRLTCKLHDLHFVDIYKIKGYNCPCGKTQITVEQESSIPGYKKYKHSYTADANTVRYNSTVLKLKDGDKPIPLNSDIKNLGVYYWDADKDRRNGPLLMEVFDGGQLLYYGNDGYALNEKWIIINKLGDAAEKKLQELKCKVFHPVVIDISVKTGEYPNTYCNSRSCKNDGCHGKVKVTDYNISKLNGYTIKKHVYGVGNFTISGFTKGPFVDKGLDKLPIWKVYELVVFFAKCSESDVKGVTDRPLLVYVSSENGSAKKWYKNSGPKNDNNWEEDNSDKLNGKSIYNFGSKNRTLIATLEEIKKKLELKCPGEEAKVRLAPPPPLPGTAPQPTASSIGNCRSSEDLEQELLKVVDYGSFLAGIFGLELAHNLAGELEHLKLWEALELAKGVFGTVVPEASGERPQETADLLLPEQPQESQREHSELDNRTEDKKSEQEDVYKRPDVEDLPAGLGADSGGGREPYGPQGDIGAANSHYEVETDKAAISKEKSTEIQNVGNISPIDPPQKLATGSSDPATTQDEDASRAEGAVTPLSGYRGTTVPLGFIRDSANQYLPGQEGGSDPPVTIPIKPDTLPDTSALLPQLGITKKTDRPTIPPVVVGYTLPVLGGYKGQSLSRLVADTHDGSTGPTGDRGYAGPPDRKPNSAFSPTILTFGPEAQAISSPQQDTASGIVEAEEVSANDPSQSSRDDTECNDLIPSSSSLLPLPGLSGEPSNQPGPRGDAGIGSLLRSIVEEALSGASRVVNDKQLFEGVAKLEKTGSDLAGAVGIEVTKAALKRIVDALKKGTKPPTLPNTVDDFSPSYDATQQKLVQLGEADHTEGAGEIISTAKPKVATSHKGSAEEHLHRSQEQDPTAPGKEDGPEGKHVPDMYAEKDGYSKSSQGEEPKDKDLEQKGKVEHDKEAEQEESDEYENERKLKTLGADSPTPLSVPQPPQPPTLPLHSPLQQALGLLHDISILSPSPQYPPGPGPTPGPRSPPGTGNRNPKILGPSIFVGVGAVSGSLTGFGWWMFKRSKGDPWVRQI